MKRKLLIALAGVGILLASGCSKDAEYFSKMKSLSHVKVIDIGTTTVGKTSYTEIEYEYNDKKNEKRFADHEDNGLKEYYDSAKLFKKELYLDLVVDEDDYIVVAALSKEDSSNDKK
ncbi:hypothetical protein M3Y14_34675 (plasmid) [Bacillus thuringiensis]|uniref:hypothetical protein n=1 Tax=Bacillus thuringiensis TaxID=1428 RepID=UPI0022258F80|nr:hypothetical protein [Bacillus thuringiensis]UYX56128.1 hypothetical protein M3Y14_34675 [Bacillus thuringiensis]